MPVSLSRLNPSDQSLSFEKYFKHDESILQYKKNNNKSNRINLYQLPQIQQYCRTNKPFVSDQKKRIIKQKLDLQQESLLKYKERQRDQDFFLSYQDNPFVNMEPKLKQKFIKHKNHQNNNLQQQLLNIPKGKQPQQSQFRQSQKSKAKQSQQSKAKQRSEQKFKQSQEQRQNHELQDIIYELNQMQQKKFQPDFIRIQQSFNLVKKTSDLLSQKTISIVQKDILKPMQDNKSPINQLIQAVYHNGKLLLSQNEKPKPEKNYKPHSKDGLELEEQEKMNPILLLLPNQPLSFQDILCIREQNFYMKPTKPLKIFRMSFQDSVHQKYIIGKQLLTKFNMSFTAVVQKIQKIKVPIYRDMSRMGRRISIGVSTGKQDILDYIESNQLSFKMNQLTFVDLMSVATNRFNAEFITKSTSQQIQTSARDKQKSETSSQNEVIQIFYPQNTKNYGLKYYNAGQQQQQIVNYLRLQLNNSQLSYKSQCQRNKKSIQSDLTTKQTLVSTTIQDHIIHGQLTQSIRFKMNSFINMDQKDIDVERIIRINKQNKNKQISIKMEKLLDIMQIKRTHDHVINKLGIMNQQKDNQSDKSMFKKKVPVTTNSTSKVTIPTPKNTMATAKNTMTPRKSSTIKLKQQSKSPIKQKSITPSKRSSQIRYGNNPQSSIKTVTPIKAVTPIKTVSRLNGVKKQVTPSKSSLKLWKH